MKERRRKSNKNDEVAKKESSQITFEAFFEQCVREGRLKRWQRLEIETFFVTDLRLKRKEDLDTYQTALEKY